MKLQPKVIKTSSNKKLQELEAKHKVAQRKKFQENFLEVRQALLQQRAELLVQLRSLEAQVESIDRTLNGWDMTLVHSYEVE